MKKLIYIISILALSLFLLTSCENDGFYYQDEARIRLEAPYILALGSDSLEYSFVTSPSSVSEIILPITVYLMGSVTDYDRTVSLGVDESHTTAQPKHYSFPEHIILPANAYSVTLPLTLNRTSDLQEAGVRLYINVVESTDFKVGIAEKNHLLIKWNDILSKPSNWDDLEEFFGTFSLVKYRFILNTLGVSGFDIETMSWAELNNYRIILITALNEYNAANPGNPLKDEYGAYVTF